MYVLYLDESGDPNGWHQGQSNLTLAGIAVFEGYITNVAEQVDAIQRRLFPTVEVPLEFHAHHINAGSGAFRQLGPDRQQELLNSIFGVIRNSRFPNLVAFSATTHVTAVQNPEQSLAAAFESICDMFNIFLIRQFNAGYPDKGILVIDRAQYSENQYRSLVARFRTSGTRLGHIGNIVDIPLFTESHRTRLMQLADHCAWAVWRYHERGDESHLGAVSLRFDRRRAGERAPVGFRHLVGPGFACPCQARHSMVDPRAE